MCLQQTLNSRNSEKGTVGYRKISTKRRLDSELNPELHDQIRSRRSKKRGKNKSDPELDQVLALSDW